MLKLDICLLDCFEYRAAAARIPVVLRLSSDAPVEVAEKIDVKQLTLTDARDPERWFGLARHILGVPKETFLISGPRPHLILSDIFNSDEDADGLTPGSYELYAKLAVYVRVGGAFERRVLEARRPLTLAA